MEVRRDKLVGHLKRCNRRQRGVGAARPSNRDLRGRRRNRSVLSIPSFIACPGVLFEARLRPTVLCAGRSSMRALDITLPFARAGPVLPVPDQDGNARGRFALLRRALTDPELGLWSSARAVRPTSLPFPLSSSAIDVCSISAVVLFKGGLLAFPLGATLPTWPEADKSSPDD